jgi:UDP-GlcNAc3NAcA epimerase
MPLRIFTVVGARPQFIKAAPVSRAFAATPGIDEQIIHTGQHFDPWMSDIFFEELGIPVPSHHLGVSGGGHGAMTGAMLQALEPLLESERPDWVLVYGDTNSTLAGALAAAKLHIPVAHVEAGLRSFNRRMPEEQNRIVTDHLADMLFTPTDTATSNLLGEGVSQNKIHQLGDVMFDAALYCARRAADRSRVLAELGLRAGGYVLATIHRAENTDVEGRLRIIFDGLNRIATELPVVLPLHPRTRKAILNYNVEPAHIKLIDPVGYLDMVALESNAAVIATDSGGVQKEAFFHGVPCVTLRDETEWVELVEAGWNRLAPPESAASIFDAFVAARGRRGSDVTPYGSGDAAQKICEAIRG